MNPNIGKPGMVGAGPGQTLQHKTLENVQAKVQQVLDYLKTHAHPEESSIKQFIAHLKGLSKDINNLQAALPSLKASYDAALSALEGAEKAFKPQKNEGTINREVLMVRNQLNKIVTAKIG